MIWVKKLNLSAIIAAFLIITAVVLFAARVEVEWQAAGGTEDSPAVPAGTQAQTQAMPPALPDEQEFSPVAETDVLSLKLHQGTGHFIVEDKRNGNLYRSYPDPKYWEREQVSNTWKQHLASPLMLQYANFGDPILQPRELSFSPDADSIKELEMIPGGFTLTYELPRSGFTIPVQVRIENDYVETKLIREGIEESQLGLIWARLYPFFGAEHTDGQDGYLFIPDGSGALIRFKDNKLNVNKIYDESVYGKNMTFPGLDNNRNPVVMPVYGMKSGDKGFLAVLDEGEEYANIIASPSGVFSNYNWVTAQMNYRSSFLQFARRNDPAEYAFVDYNKEELFGSDRATRYYLLDGGDTGYVGMAQRYRQYLMEERGLQPLADDTDELPLHVSIVGGDQEKGTLANRYIKGTSTSEAAEIVQKLYDSGIHRMSVTYMGWQEGGYSAYGQTFPVDSRIGGYEGMKQFVDYAHSLGIPVYLDTEYSLNNTGAGGFKEKFHAVVNLAGQNIDVRIRYNSDRIVTVSEKFIEQILSKDLEKFKELGVDGLVVNRTGRNLHSDYNTQYGSARDEARDVQESIVAAIQAELGGVQGVNSNFYVLPYVSHIQNMVSDYSYDLFTDEQVPFAQISTHGLITYSFQHANNREESVNDFLREIEYGAVPSFVFTYAETKQFLNAYGIRFYNTHYPDWILYAMEEYRKFNEALGDVQDQFIVNHRTLASHVKETTYANGKRIIVNYTTEPYRYGDLEVPAQGFSVIPGEANQ